MKKKFDYKTIFLWKFKTLYIFYKYHTGLIIPTGYDFIYRNKHYSTSLLMTLLSDLYKMNKFPTIVYDKNYWNKDNFIKFYNDLKRTL